MRRAILLLALGCLFAAASAHAQPFGVALRWNHCFGEGSGVASKNFACDTNSGFEELIGSFAIGENMVNVSANEIVVEVTTAYPYWGQPGLPTPPPLPEWWKFRNAGTCRQFALTGVFAADAANAVCQDWGAGLEIGGLGAYAIDYYGQGTARIAISVAVPADAMQSLSAAIEYYSFTLRISHAKTVGTGACGGCTTPLYLVFNRINVVTDTLANNRLYAGPLNGTDSNFASWNLSPVPTRSATWGVLKSLYR